MKYTLNDAGRISGRILDGFPHQSKMAPIDTNVEANASTGQAETKPLGTYSE